MRLDLDDSVPAPVPFRGSIHRQRMQITIKLYGNLRKHLPEKKETARMEIENGATIHALLARLGVLDSNVWMCAINDQVVADSTALREGDVLEVFEPVGGGSIVPSPASREG